MLGHSDWTASSSHFACVTPHFTHLHTPNTILNNLPHWIFCMLPHLIDLFADMRIVAIEIKRFLMKLR